MKSFFAKLPLLETITKRSPKRILQVINQEEELTIIFSPLKIIFDEAIQEKSIEFFFFPKMALECFEKALTA